MGARVDLIDVDGLGFLPIGSNGATFAAGRKFATSSGSVGMLWDLGAEITASLTGNRIERAPDALELFAKGPHEATETFEIGDPNLKTETALSVEASLKRLEGAVTFDIAGYYTAYKNFIFKAFTGLECGEDFSSCGSETELAQILYGQRDAEFYGVEAQAAWEVARFGAGVLGIEGRFDFVRGVFKSGGNAPRIPALRFGGGLTYESAAWNARIDLLRASKQNKTGAFETATKGYLRMDAELFYTFTFRDTKTNIDVGVTAQNILDEDARNHVSFKKVDMLLPGRNFRFVVRAAF
jgi:iron complex outermembrane receptor protein